MGDLSPHFSRHEIACSDGKCPYCGGAATVTDVQLAALEKFWNAVTDWAKEQGLDELKPHAVIVTSGYRCPEKNKRTPGASKNSPHMSGTAEDVVVKVFTPGHEIGRFLTGRELYDVAMRVPEFAGGGIGVYVKQESGRDRIHVDSRGHPARWAYIGNERVDLMEALCVSCKGC